MSKFCKKCGTELSEEVAFCYKCGESCSDTPAEEKAYIKKTEEIKISDKSKKKIIAIVATLVVIIGLFAFPSVTNEPCDWCGDSPSFKYRVSGGEKAYVCGDCREECSFCGDKAKKHYESSSGMIVFVCKDCYKEVKG